MGLGGKEPTNNLKSIQQKENRSMKNHRIKLLSVFTIIVAVLWLLFAVQPVDAQVIIPAPTINGASGVSCIVNASSTTNYIAGEAQWVVPRANKVAVQATFNLFGAGTSAVAFVFERSVDGVNWMSWTGMTNTAAGTATVTGIRLLDLEGCSYMRCRWVTNVNAEVVTNLSLTLGKKDTM